MVKQLETYHQRLKRLAGELIESHTEYAHTDIAQWAIDYESVILQLAEYVIDAEKDEPTENDCYD